MTHWGCRASHWHSRRAWKCLNDAWHMAPVSHIPSPGGRYSQIRILPVGFPPLLSSWVDTGALQGSSAALSSAMLSQSPPSHTGAAFSADQLLSPTSFPVLVTDTLEADFTATLATSCFAVPWNYLKGVQEEFIDDNWESPQSGWLLPEGQSSNKGDNALNFSCETFFSLLRLIILMYNYIFICSM